MILLLHHVAPLQSLQLAVLIVFLLVMIKGLTCDCKNIWTVWYISKREKEKKVSLVGGRSLGGVWLVSFQKSERSERLASRSYDHRDSFIVAGCGSHTGRRYRRQNITQRKHNKTPLAETIKEERATGSVSVEIQWRCYLFPTPSWQ